MAQKAESHSEIQENAGCDHEEGLLPRPEEPPRALGRRVLRRAAGVSGVVLLCGVVAGFVWLGPAGDATLTQVFAEGMLTEYLEQCSKCGHACDCGWVSTRGACQSPPKGGSCCWDCCCRDAGHDVDPGYDVIPHVDAFHGSRPPFHGSRPSYHGSRPVYHVSRPHYDPVHYCKYNVGQHVYVHGDDHHWSHAIVKQVLPGCHYRVTLSEPHVQHVYHHIYHPPAKHWTYNNPNWWWIPFVVGLALLSILVILLARR